MVSELARHISANAPDAKDLAIKPLAHEAVYETYRDDENSHH